MDYNFDKSWENWIGLIYTYIVFISLRPSDNSELPDTVIKYFYNVLDRAAFVHTLIKS